MKSLRLLSLLGLLFVSGQTLVADDAKSISVLSVATLLHSDPSSPLDKQPAQIDWQVPVAKWLKTPRWQPEKEPVPLDAEGAAVAAKRWIAAQPWADQFESFDEIELVCWQGEPEKPGPVDGLWYYNVTFNLKEIRKDAPSPGPMLVITEDARLRNVVLLLDGTVIEPAMPKPAPKAGRK